MDTTEWTANVRNAALILAHMQEENTAQVMSSFLLLNSLRISAEESTTLRTEAQPLLDELIAFLHWWANSGQFFFADVPTRAGLLVKQADTVMVALR